MRPDTTSQYEIDLTRMMFTSLSVFVSLSNLAIKSHIKYTNFIKHQHFDETKKRTRQPHWFVLVKRLLVKRNMFRGGALAVVYSNCHSSSAFR